ncbi:MAG: FAD-dependent oxidoreductase [Deltaproteobacteria bacterium]|nr:FAD-dependent oxidoreductase [Deltaproteobacteria bacterium]
MTKTTLIIGGGIAGLTLAQSLVQSGYDSKNLVIVDRPVLGQTGSTNPGGLLNPVPGASLNPKPGTLKAFRYTMSWIETFPSALRAQCITNLKLLRPFNLEIQPGRRLLKSFQQSQEILNEHVGVRQLSTAELQEVYPHLNGCDGAIEFAEAATLPMNEVSDYLTQKLIEAGVCIKTSQVLRVSNLPNHWQVDLHGESIEAEQVVFATGSELLQFFPNLPLRSTAGYLAQITMPSAFPKTHAVSGRGHLCPMADGSWILGATYHQESAPEPEDDAALRQILLSKIGQWVGETHQSEWLGSWRGVRAVIAPEKQPLIGAIPGSSGLFVLGGFASRGLQWAPYCSQQLATHLMGAPLALPKSILSSRLNAETWILNAQKQAHQTSPS